MNAVEKKMADALTAVLEQECSRSFGGDCSRPAHEKAREALRAWLARSEAK